MITEFLALAVLLGSMSDPESLGDPFADTNSIVIRGTLKSLSRTDDPTNVYKIDRVVLSNSCGYDTAIFEVREVLLGEYELKELAAHLHLGEFCGSILQTEVKDYVVYLAWTGKVWEMRNELSSPVLKARGRNWLVEPALLEFVVSRQLSETQPVRFREAELAEIAVGRMRRKGYVREGGTTYGEWVSELKSWKPPHGWRDNPLYFARGLELDSFRQLLASNYALQRTALTGRR